MKDLLGIVADVHREGRVEEDLADIPRLGEGCADLQQLALRVRLADDLDAERQALVQPRRQRERGC